MQEYKAAAAVAPAEAAAGRREARVLLAELLLAATPPRPEAALPHLLAAQEPSERAGLVRGRPRDTEDYVRSESNCLEAVISHLQARA